MCQNVKRYEGHQNCPKILSINILRVFSDHHLWRQNWRQYLWTSLCQFNFFVNLLHSLGVWFFDIWHFFDNMTSFWQLDIFLIFWEQITHGPHCPCVPYPCTPYPCAPIAHVPHTPSIPLPMYPLHMWCIPLVPHTPWAPLPIGPIPLYPLPIPLYPILLCPYCPCAPYPCTQYPQRASLPIYPTPLVPHFPCDPLPMWLIPLVPHNPCAHCP